MIASKLLELIAAFVVYPCILCNIAMNVQVAIKSRHHDDCDHKRGVIIHAG